MMTLKTTYKIFLTLIGFWCFLFCSSYIVQAAQTSLVIKQNSLLPKQVYNQKLQYAHDALRVLDVSEIEVDGESRLQVTFSIPLNRQQDFSHLLHLVDTETGILSGHWLLSENGMELTFSHLPAKRKLTLTIDNDLKDINDHMLRHRYQQVISTRQKSPSISFSSTSGAILSPFNKMSLPVVALNIDNIDVNFYHVNSDKEAVFLKQLNENDNNNMYAINELMDYTTLAYTGRYHLPIKTDVRQTFRLPLDHVPQLQKQGIYLAVMHEAGKYNYYLASTTFMVSDIGLSVFHYDNKLLISTSSLNQGQPLSKVNISILDKDNQEQNSGTTDNQGWLEISNVDKNSAALIVATQGNQVSIIDLRHTPLDLSEFNIGGKQYYSPTQFAFFAPRDLYRVGEKVIINGLLRNDYGQSIENTPLMLDIISPDGDIQQKTVWKSTNGLYQFSYPLPKSAQTGLWTARVALADNHYAYYSFHVEDFMPERMALTLTPASQSALINNEDITFNLEGHYLYGAPASNNNVNYQINLTPLHQLDLYPGYEFGTVNDNQQARTLSQDSLSLNEKGQGTLTLDDNLNDLTSPFNILLNASLLDVGGRPVTRHVIQTIWPAQTLPGIRPLFKKSEIYNFESDKEDLVYSVDENSQASFDIINANRQGQLLPTTSDFAVKLIRERYNYYWTWEDNGRWSLHQDKKEFIQSQENIRIKKNDKAHVSFPVEWGYYRLEVTDPDTGIMSNLRFNAGYSWSFDGKNQDAIRPDQVKLKLDKPNYLPGQTLHVMLQSPNGGKGYILVQSTQGILFKQRVTLPKTGATVAIPVNDAWKREDLYLVAEIIQPTSTSSVPVPKRALGILHIPMMAPNRHLQITLVAPDKTLPDTTTQVHIQIKKPDGSIPKNTMVSVSAVDSGVLNITQFVTPDPYRQFFEQKRYKNESWDIYDHLIGKEGKLAQLKFGGDGDDEGEENGVNAFNAGGKQSLNIPLIVAQQLKPVAVDKNGIAVVNLALPNFNGELRLMAQAWSNDSFGAGEKTMKVAWPVIAELSTPRFLGAGDISNLALDLHNNSPKPQTFKLEVTASGLIQLSSPLSKMISLKEGQRQIINIPVYSQNAGFGKGTVNVALIGVSIPGVGDNQTINRQVSIPVRPIYPAVTKHYETMLEPNTQWVFPQQDLMDSVPSSIQAITLLNHVPTIDLHRYISELYAYPYGCIEQTTSGVFPSLYTNHDELVSLGIKTSSDEQRRLNINKAITKIENMQLENGGFGFWDSSSFESYWGTVYATDFLLSAQKQGFSVQQNTINQAIARLQEYIRDPMDSINNINDDYDSDETRFAAQTYAAYILARENLIFTSDIINVTQQMPSHHSSLELIQLAIAAKLSGNDQLFKQLLAMDKNTPENNTWYAWDYGSSVRDDALKYVLLDQYHIESLDNNPNLMQLLHHINERNWFSTQESNAIFMLGKQLQNIAAKKIWTADINGHQFSNKKAVYQSIKEDQIRRSLIITNKGTTPLYTSTNINFYPLHAPNASGDIRIYRQYYSLSGNPMDIHSLHEGDLILVALDIKSDENIPDALITDLLPAGLELENQHLDSSSASLALAQGEGKALVDSSTNDQIDHQEFRDDRYVASLSLSKYDSSKIVYLARAVTPGRYQVPNPMVQSMYSPEEYGIGSTAPEMIILPKPLLVKK